MASRSSIPAGAIWMVAITLLLFFVPGVNGLEVCKQIRQNPKTQNTPVIFLTAKGMVGDMMEGKEAGSDLYLVKPVLASKILNMVSIFLSSDQPLAKKPKGGASG